LLQIYYSNSEEILKIGKHLRKLCLKN